MWVFLSVVMLCMTIAYICRTGVRFEPRIAVTIAAPEAPTSGGNGLPDQLPVMDESVLKFISQESSSHAREDLRVEANKLYAISGKWDVVLNILTQRYTERTD